LSWSWRYSTPAETCSGFSNAPVSNARRTVKSAMLSSKRRLPACMSCSGTSVPNDALMVLSTAMLASLRP